jgi:formate-dependent nitrite reductase membrane component NrfD
MEVTPLPGIFLCISSVLLCFWIELVVMILSIFFLSFVLWVGVTLSHLLLRGVPKPKLPHLLFEILLDFDGILVGRAQ